MSAACDARDIFQVWVKYAFFMAIVRKKSRYFSYYFIWVNAMICKEREGETLIQPYNIDT